MPEAEQVIDKSKEKKPLSKGGKMVLWIVGVIILIIVAIVLFAPRTKFTVSDIQIVSNTADTVSVSFKIKNDGGAAALPTCNITAHSDYIGSGTDSKYAGAGMMSLTHDLAAGDSIGAASGTIKINDNGAANVHTAEVTCN